MQNTIPTTRTAVLNLVALLMILSSAITAQALSLYDAKETRQISAFKHLEANGLVNVILQSSDEERLDIAVSGIDLDQIISDVDGDTLRLDTKGRHSGERINIVLFYKTLESIKTTGAATVKTRDAIQAETLTVSAEESGDATLEVKVDLIDISMKGHGNLTVYGTTRHQSITSHGTAGTFDNTKLNVVR